MSSFNVINSGLDVQTIVDQLIEVERAPIQRLETQNSTLGSKIKAFQSLNSRLSALLDKLDYALFTGETATLTIPSGFLERLAKSVFAARTASSSNDSALAVTAEKGSALGSYAVTVTSLARAKTSASASFADTDTLATGTGTLVIQMGSEDPVTVTIDASNSTLAGVRDAINASNAGVSATIINDGTAAPYRLLLASRETGTANAFTVTDNLTGGQALALAETQSATDAQFTVNGISLTKSSNVVSDVISGVTFTLKATTTDPVEISLEKDIEPVVTALKELIAAFNAVSSFANAQSAYNSETKKAGILAGDSTLRSTMSRIRSILTKEITGGDTSWHYLSQLGVRFNNDGSLSLDEAKLRNALESDTTGVAALFLGDQADGILVDLRAVLKNLTDPLDGPIQRATDGLNGNVRSITKQISEYEERLEVRRERLLLEYARADQALRLLSVTQTSLSNQFSNLAKLAQN